MQHVALNCRPLLVYSFYSAVSSVSGILQRRRNNKVSQISFAQAPGATGRRIPIKLDALQTVGINYSLYSADIKIKGHCRGACFILPLLSGSHFVKARGSLKKKIERLLIHVNRAPRSSKIYFHVELQFPSVFVI